MIGAITAGLFGTGVAASTTAFESIATSTVGAGGTSTITFSSIPSTYKHLQIRYIARNDATAAKMVMARFNSDSGANYNGYHMLYGNGTTAAADYSGTFYTTVACLGLGSNAGNATANAFGLGVADILDYADTNKYKTTRTLWGYDNNGSGWASIMSSAWRSTAAINSITLTLDNAANFAQYSSFALYGIKG